MIQKLIIIYLCLFYLASPFSEATLNHAEKEAYRQTNILLSIQDSIDLGFDERNVYIFLNGCYNLLKDTLSDIKDDKLGAEDEISNAGKNSRVTSESIKLMESLINLYDSIIERNSRARSQQKQQFDALVHEIAFKVTEFEQNLQEKLEHIGRYLVSLVAIKEDNNARGKMLAYKNRKIIKAEGKMEARNFWTTLLRKIFE